MDADQSWVIVRERLEGQIREYVRDWAAATGTKITGMNANILVEGLLLTVRRELVK